MSEPQLRTIKDGPFCWQGKAARRKIREAAADMKNGSAVMGIYDALCEIASDEQSEFFRCSHPHIAAKAMLSVATVKRALPILEELSLANVISNERPGSKLKATNTYALLPIAHTDLSIAHSDPCIAHSQNNGQLSQSRRILEESKKNDDDKALAREQEHATGKSSSSCFLNLEEAMKHPRWKEFAAYCKGSPTLKGFNTWLPKQLPLKPGQEPKRKWPRIDLEAAERDSIAKADRENGLHV